MATQVASDKAAWQVMASKLAATGWCSKVQIGEPKEPPDPVTGCVLGESGFIDENTLSAPREVHQALLRFYAPFISDNPEQVEFDLEQVRANVWADINGDFDLGGNVAYILPSRCSWRWGNLDVGRVMYRILDIVVAYRLDDKATFTQ